jgi:hypothetical protein
MGNENENTNSVNEVIENDDLINRLSVNTQHKAETLVKTETWDFDADANDFKDDNKDNIATDANIKSTDKEIKVEDKPSAKITEKAKRASARTAVGMLDLTQKSLFTPLLTSKYKKKFSKEEQDKLLEIEFKDKKELEGDDLALSNKFEKLMGRMNKKIDAIPLEESEKTDLEEAFFSYFDYKEKTLPPEWFVGMAVVNAIGKRAIDVFTD